MQFQGTTQFHVTNIYKTKIFHILIDLQLVHKTLVRWKKSKAHTPPFIQMLSINIHAYKVVNLCWK